MKLSTTALALALLAAPAAARAAGVNDAQIASIVVTANQVDVDAGKLAAATTANAEVKKFAELMVSDHTAVNNSAVALVTKLGVKPEDNPTSQSLKKEGGLNVDHLHTLHGAAFDKAYVDHEVAYHQAVLDAIDKVLVPSAQNAELKSLIVKVRPAIQAHLDHAKHLQGDLGKNAGKK